MSRHQAAVAAAAIERAMTPDVTVGIYLYGSALAGGLRPDSDLDLALVTARRLTGREKTRLFDAIRPLSRRALRPDGWRPLEVSVLALPDVHPWRYPAPIDAQYGEWLTDAELGEQVRAGPVAAPDLAVLITMLRRDGDPYVGPPAADVLDPVPHPDLVRATLDAIPALLADLEDDTRNVLLTLARMWTTTATGAILSKDDAAEWARERLPAGDGRLLSQARDLYLAGGSGVWTTSMAEVRRLAERLWDEIRASAADVDADGD